MTHLRNLDLAHLYLAELSADISDAILADISAEISASISTEISADISEVRTGRAHDLLWLQNDLPAKSWIMHTQIWHWSSVKGLNYRNECLRLLYIDVTPKFGGTRNFNR